jgi:preprotein translocase subunit SecA
MRMDVDIRESISRARCWRLAAHVNRLGQQIKDLSDNGLQGRVAELRERRRKGAELHELMPRMFALVREASRRAIGIRQYDLQIAGGGALAAGQVMELDTGEGKTFITPLAACLYALDQRGVHVLTANDYLAGRDGQILRPVYEVLGFTLGVVLADTPPRERARAHRADITYSTVPQLGFDFLRQYFQQAPDSLRTHDMWRFLRSEIDGTTREQRCLRGRYCAILDEADSILIDYARSPLSVSVEADVQRPPEAYAACRAFALDSMIQKMHYTLDEAKRKIELTDRGKKHVLTLREDYGYLHIMDSEWQELVREALLAEHLFNRGEHYVVQGATAVLVDQTSGRLMIGQRLGGELHQAVEAKEGLPIQPRQSIAKKVTIQSLMRPYEHLAGLTGTAWEARKEFGTVYDMRTVRFAPRLPSRRHYRPSLFFSDSDARWEAVADDVAREHDKGRPVLVGTCSVDKSRLLSQMLSDRGISHEVLNAVDHANEAQVIAGAGNRGAVTVATNMAGRGVEFKLGEGVRELGGMHVVGTERHTLARLDRQLAGRVGRRGAPGTVQFFASAEDDVLLALSERRRRKMKTRAGSASRPVISTVLDRTYAKAQEAFRAHFAQVRRMLLVQDLAQEEADKILFGQQNL